MNCILIINDALNQVAHEVRCFLKAELPKLTSAWWKNLVLDKLSYHQKLALENHPAPTVEALDLAALLRVFDKNWEEINDRNKLFNSELRSHLNEIRNVRHRYAHLTAQTPANKDIYRDLDTMHRFLKKIGAGEEILLNLEKQMIHILAAMNSHPPEKSGVTPAATQAPAPQSSCFEKGSLVFLKSDPSQKGAVMDCLLGKPENRIKVFMDGKIQEFYESQIQNAAAAKTTGDDCAPATLHRFHATLTSLQLLQPGISQLYSFNAARIHFVPYQFRPVMKLIRSDSPRILIADEVGVGKTIEAGLILRELQARKEVSRVLILCPKALVSEKKWHAEMKRFDENFTQLDGKAFRYCLEETHKEDWPLQHHKTILPFSLFDKAALEGTKKCKGLLELDSVRFDLVIVDEVHHARNPSTYTHQCVRYFCERADAVVFLSATPIQIGSQNLFNLLSILRPDLVLDQTSFEFMSEPNAHINEAVRCLRTKKEDWRGQALKHLEMAAQTDWGKRFLDQDPVFSEIYDTLSAGELDDTCRVSLRNKTESLNSFNRIINRTRRRDIGNFTTRKPFAQKIAFTKEQRELYEKVLHIQREILKSKHGNKSVEFLMGTIRRQLSSCLFGLAPLLGDILENKLDDIMDSYRSETDEEKEGGEETMAIEIKVIGDDIAEMRGLLEKMTDEDPKFNALIGMIREKQSHPNNKILLFTTFRHTLRYIKKRISGEPDIRFAQIHGGIKDEERVETRRRFSLDRNDPQAIDILLCSDVGSEGLDYQFCEALVNYDIPWNPMKIEQRIGRIDRYGQKSETVSIHNFITAETVDEIIYTRCLQRIGVFEQALGASEEILGQISEEIRKITDNLTLTQEEMEARLIQLSDNQISLIQEQEKLENEQIELLGLRIPKEEIEREVKSFQSYWLSKESLARLVESYLRERTQAVKPLVTKDNLQKLCLKKEARRLLLKDFKEMDKRHTATSRAKQWKDWLDGDEDELPVTFDSAEASRNWKLSFINPVHPLVVQAAKAHDSGKIMTLSLRAPSSPHFPKGEIAFAIYLWEKKGVNLTDTEMVVVTDPPERSASFFEIIESAQEGTSPKPISDAVKKKLDELHYEKWSRAKAAHSEHSQKTADYKIGSLQRSTESSIAFSEKMYQSVPNEKIRKMRESQIASLKNELTDKTARLKEDGEKADILPKLVALGTVQIQ